MAREISGAELDNIEQTFKQFDADGSRTIDVSELGNVMEHLGVSMQPENLRDLVEQVDVSGNGELEFDEFKQLLTMWKDASRFKLFEGPGFESLTHKRMNASLELDLLLPDSVRRNVWVVLVVLAATVNWFIVFLEDAWGKQTSPEILFVDILVTIIFSVDIGLKAITFDAARDSPGDSKRVVALRYLRSSFILDFLAAFPFDLILYYSGARLAAQVCRHLRLIKCFRTPWMFKMSGRIPITSNYVRWHFSILPVAQLLLFFVQVVHFFAVGFMMVKFWGGNELEPDTDAYPYTKALYFVVYTLTTVGYGDVEVTTHGERWYAILVLLGAFGVNGYIVGKLVDIMQKADIRKDRHGKLRSTLAELESFSIPNQLLEEVLQFQDHLLEHSLSASYSSIVSGLPPEMQSNISLFVKLRLISTVPVLEKAHYIVKIAIAEILVNTVALPEQYVIMVGDPLTAMYFVAHGFADVFGLDSSHMRTLRAGQFFAEDALLLKQSARHSVKALTYCDMWELHRSDFIPLLRRFPKFTHQLRQYGKQQRKSAPEDGSLVKVLTTSGSAPRRVDAMEASGMGSSTMSHSGAMFMQQVRGGTSQSFDSTEDRFNAVGAGGSIRLKKDSDPLMASSHGDGAVMAFTDENGRLNDGSGSTSVGPKTFQGFGPSVPSRSPSARDGDSPEVISPPDSAPHRKRNVSFVGKEDEDAVVRIENSIQDLEIPEAKLHDDTGSEGSSGEECEEVFLRRMESFVAFGQTASMKNRKSRQSSRHIQRSLRGMTKADGLKVTKLQNILERLEVCRIKLEGVVGDAKRNAGEPGMLNDVPSMQGSNPLST